MATPNTAIDAYLAEGCGRCNLHATPACKVHRWQPELAELRRIALASGLTEERKWGVPCYTLGKANIFQITALKEYCAIGFFQGSLLKDPEGLLQAPGPNSQAARMLRFTAVDQILAQEDHIAAFIRQAVALAESGARVAFRSADELVLPEELHEWLEQDSALKAAFDALTPGRRRGWALLFGQPKKPETRLARIRKHIPDILAGKGPHDDFRGKD